MSYTDDPHVAGQADVRGSHTIYDSDGESWKPTGSMAW